MGNWNMTVVGVGAHHNTNYRADADKMFKTFTQGLQDAGHTINHASFTHGGAELVARVNPNYSGGRMQPSFTEVEGLAKELHEAGRSAVEKGLVVNKVPGQPFFEWDQLTEVAQEGRREQARFLLSRFVLIAR